MAIGMYGAGDSENVFGIALLCGFFCAVVRSIEYECGTVHLMVRRNGALCYFKFDHTCDVAYDLFMKGEC